MVLLAAAFAIPAAEAADKRPWSLGLRVSGEFADTIFEALEGLHERQAAPWLEPLALWDAHRRRRVNHGVELCLLASLEMNLRYEAAGAS